MAELLRGRLGPLQLTTILQLAGSDELSGWLTLTGEGRVGLRDGAIVAAERGALRGDAALMVLILRCPEQCAFVFEDEPQPTGTPLGQTQWMVMRAAQYADEWAQLAPQVLAPSAPDAPPPGLDEAARWMDGTRTLAEVVGLCGGLHPKIIDDISNALENSGLRVAGPPDAARAAAAQSLPDSNDFFELVDEGRALLRARRLAEAELVFARAAQLRPDDRVVHQNLRRVQQLRVAERAS